MNKKLGGSLGVLLTPFDEDFRVAPSRVPAMMDRQISAGVDGFWVVGIAGEGANLTLKEKQAIVPVAVKAAGDAYVLVSVAGMTFAECLEFSQFCESEGVDVLNVLPPPQHNWNEDDVYEFFRAICKSVSIPVSTYQAPQFTGVNFTPAFLARLADGIPNFRGVAESTGDVTVLSKYDRMLPDDFVVWVGRENTFYAALLLGADGVCGPVACIAPELQTGIVRAVREGDHATARALQPRLSIMTTHIGIGGGSPTATKAMLEMLGLPGGSCRPPLRPPSEAVKAQLRQIMIDAGVIGKDKA